MNEINMLSWRKRTKISQQSPTLAEQNKIGCFRVCSWDDRASASWQLTHSVDIQKQHFDLVTCSLKSKFVILLRECLFTFKKIILIQCYCDCLCLNVNVYLIANNAMVFTGREYDCLRMVFSVPMSNLRRRGCILVLSCLVLVPFFGIVLFSAPG